MIQLKQLLVPTDFSRASEDAVAYGKELAAKFGARLHLLHVLEEGVVYGGSMPLPQSVEAEIEAEAKKNLARYADGDKSIELTIRKGSPFVEIVRHAREANIDLIVLGTHGRGPIAHMLLGSVAERVTQKAHCPVLTIRQTSEAFSLP